MALSIIIIVVFVIYIGLSYAQSLKKNKQNKQLIEQVKKLNNYLEKQNIEDNLDTSTECATEVKK